jgi:hypothetical protein
MLDLILDLILDLTPDLMLDLMLLAKAQVVQSRPRVGWRGKRNEAI